MLANQIYKYFAVIYRKIVDNENMCIVKGNHLDCIPTLPYVLNNCN